MTKNELLTAIKSDLGANFKSDDNQVISGILDETIENALIVSNRKRLAIDAISEGEQISILASEIRKAVKTLYLQRGSEDVSALSKSGVSSTYADAQDVLRRDIIKNGKRIYA